MFNEFLEDYRAAGDDFRESGKGDFFVEAGADRTSYIFMYEGRTAGFITLRHEGDDTEETEIEVVYVCRQFRGLGLSSCVYRWAIVDKNATEISLTCRRIRDRIPYWRALGFTRFMTYQDQRGTEKSLFSLSTKKGVQLSSWDLKQVRQQMYNDYMKTLKALEAVGKIVA